MAETDDTPQVRGVQVHTPQVHGAPVHRASYEFELGPIRSRASASITTNGLLAVGAATAVILLSVVPIVWAATGLVRARARRADRRALPDRDL